jgi:hypothetical protein
MVRLLPLSTPGTRLSVEPRQRHAPHPAASIEHDGPVALDPGVASKLITFGCRESDVKHCRMTGARQHVLRGERLRQAGGPGQVASRCPDGPLDALRGVTPSGKGSLPSVSGASNERVEPANRQDPEAELHRHEHAGASNEKPLISRVESEESGHSLPASNSS